MIYPITKPCGAVLCLVAAGQRKPYHPEGKMSGMERKTCERSIPHAIDAGNADEARIAINAYLMNKKATEAKR